MNSIDFAGFTINIAKSQRKKRTSCKPTRVSKLCKARVVLDEDGIYKAEINLKNDDTHPAHLIIPFTPDSYDLHDKIYVFSKEKTERNNYTCFVRTEENAKYNPGLDTQYNAFKPDIVIGGYIVRIDGKNYFDYVQLVSFNYKYEDYISIITRDDNPIFKKRI